MNDVEKYGLFAVVFVGGVLLVIALQGGFSGGDAAAAAAPVVIAGDVPLSAPVPESSGQPPTRVRVRSIMPDTSFDWDEPPMAYPGERSAGHVEPSGSDRAVAPAGAPVMASAPNGMHAVAANETLSDIARRHLGTESRWKELVALNPGLDPRKLQIGQLIRVSPNAGAPPPAAPASVTTAPAAGAAPALADTATKNVAKAAPKSPASGRTHTVVKGDTLGAIAKQYLGSAARADDIWAANKDVLKSKDDLAIGQALRIP